MRNDPLSPVSNVSLANLPGEALVDGAGTDELDVGIRRQPGLDLGEERLEMFDAASLGGALGVAGAAVAHRRVVSDVPAGAGVRGHVGCHPLQVDHLTVTPGDPRLATVDPDDDSIAYELRPAGAGSLLHESAHAGRSSNRSARLA